MSFTFWGLSVDEFNVFHLFWVSFQEWNRTVPMWDFPVWLKNKSPCITNHLITWLLLCADGCSVKLGCGGGTFLYCHSLVTKIKTHQAIECALLFSQLCGGRGNGVTSGSASLSFVSLPLFSGVCSKQKFYTESQNPRQSKQENPKPAAHLESQWYLMQTIPHMFLSNNTSPIKQSWCPVNVRLIQLCSSREFSVINSVSTWS